jgi:hypothetical protein
MISDKVRVLVLDAVACGVGSVRDIMSVIGPQLTPDEYKEVRGFLKWCFFDWWGRGFGPLNINIKWNEWKAACPPTSYKKGASYFGKSISRPDSKGMTVRDLFSFLTQVSYDPKMVAAKWDQPIVMSSDEEGNEMLSLAMIEVSKSGKITLYPAQIY